MTHGALWEPQMITYRFTIEGEITAADAVEAYDALTEVLARIADSLESYAPQVELKEEIRITLAPLPDSDPAAEPRSADSPGRVVGAGDTDGTVTGPVTGV